MNDNARFVWIDLEMTGLDPDTCAIIEIAAVVTGPDLLPLAEIERTIWQPDEVLARMEPVVRDMHSQNGLTDRVRSTGISLREAEREVFATISGHCEPGQAMLAGNSIYYDRRFLAKYMPMVERTLHHRQLDVSSLKVLARAWYPQSPQFRKGNKNHTALADVRDSLEELAHYRKAFFHP